MKAVVVGVAGILLAAVVHAAPSSKVTPPAGWLEDTSETTVPGLKAKPSIVRSDITTWIAPDETALFRVIEIEMKLENTRALTMINSMEYDVKRLVGSARELLASTRRETADTVVVDHALEIEGRRAHLQRHYAVDENAHLHAVALWCLSPLGAEDVPACAPAFASFRWTFKPAGLPKTRAKDAAYKLREYGWYLGFGIIIVVLLVIEPIRRKKKRERAA